MNEVEVYVVVALIVVPLITLVILVALPPRRSTIR